MHRYLLLFLTIVAFPMFAQTTGQIQIIEFNGTTFDARNITLPNGTLLFRNSSGTLVPTTGILSLSDSGLLTPAAGITIPAAGNFTWTAGATFGGSSSAFRSVIGLGSVENTALSTWIGSTNITTTGNVSTGTWSGLFGTVSGANLTNLTPANIAAGTAGISISGNAATVTTNANLTGVVTSVGNATAIADAALAIAKTSGLQSALDSKITGSNVKTFGAHGDAVKLTDGASTNTDQTVTSASGNFNASDIGKVIWGVKTDGTVVLNTTIAAINSATSIELTDAATGTATGLSIIYGTDDTSAIQAAAVDANTSNPPKTVALPAGGYIISATPFNFLSASSRLSAPHVVGEGSTNTVFYPNPTFTPTSSCLINVDGNNRHGLFQGFSVDGSAATISGTVRVLGSFSAYNQFTDIVVLDIGVSTAGVQVGATSWFTNCYVEGVKGVRGIYVSDAAATFTDCYSGNNDFQSLEIRNSSKVTWSGGFLDEVGGGGSVETVYAGETSQLKLDCVHAVYGGGTIQAVTLHDTAVLRASNTPIGPYTGRPDGTGLHLVDAGTVAYLQGVTLTSSGTGVSLNNSGTVYDGSSNTIGSVSGTAMVSGLDSDTRLTPPGVDISGATVTASTPVLTTAQTWNDGGVTFIGKDNNFTSTASAADSVFERWRLGGTQKFAIRKSGQVDTQSGVFNAEFDAKFYSYGALMLTLDAGGPGFLASYPMQVAAAQYIGFYNGGTGLSDLKLSMPAAGVMKVGDSGSAYGAVTSLYERFGSGSPEGVETAPVGAIYHRTDGGAGTSNYFKESGTGNTGWIAK